MTYPSESFAGAATPTHVTLTFSASAMSATFHDLSTWVELGTNDPLGTSGDFVIVVDYGKTSEEKIRCSALNANTGVITFLERGFDDTTPAVHSAGQTSKPNCFPVLSASDIVAIQDEIAVASALASTADQNATQALSDASEALSVADAAVQSVSGDGSTITVSGTAQEPVISVTANTFDAYGAASSKVASVTAADSTITVAGTSTNPTVKVGTVPYGQVSGTPTSLPPSGSAGGDLTGTYPNPSVVAGSTSTAGKLQLTDSTSSTSTTTAATPNAVKSAYDLASSASSSASSKVASVTAGDSTITIGGTATAPTVKVTANTFDPYGASSNKVASVTAGDSTVTIGGTATAPTIAVAQANLTIAESQVTNLSTDLAGKVPTTRSVSTSSPLSGGGALSSDLTLSIQDGTTTQKGAVQLSTSTSSTSTTLASTPSAVKSAYDLANAALPKAGGTMSGAIAMGSQRITGLSTAPGATTDAATVAMAGDAFPLTGLFNYLAWTNDPNVIVGTSVPVIGTVYYSAIYIPVTTNIANISIYVSSQGASLTNSYVGLYNATTQLGVSAAITTGWQTTGTKTHALTATSAGSLTNVAPGIYWVAILVGNGSTTAPTLVRSAGLTANFTNVSLSATLSTLTVRAATGGTGQTALPGSIGLNAVVSQSFWAALS